MSGPGKPTDISKNQRALRADTADRLEAIVEAAERAAEGVIDDAEKQAHRYLAQARAEAERKTVGRGEEVAELLDTLLGQAVSLRREAERLQATLEAARAQLGGEGSPAPAPPREEPPEAPRLRAVQSAEAPAAEPRVVEPATELESRRADASGARLLATQMAVSGSSREEIAQRLRNGFESEDPDAILDAILGPEG
jgi:cell division septum initiation protein DivIVA